MSIRAGVKTHLTNYGVREDQLPGVIDKLKQHGMVELGEHGKVSQTPASKFYRLVYNSDVPTLFNAD